MSEQVGQPARHQQHRYDDHHAVKQSCDGRYFTRQNLGDGREDKRSQNRAENRARMKANATSPTPLSQDNIGRRRTMKFRHNPRLHLKTMSRSEGQRGTRWGQFFLTKYVGVVDNRAVLLT